jgi:hypothetical protein
MPAFITGERIAVLDVDRKLRRDGPGSLERLTKEIGPLPATTTVRSPSGGLLFCLAVPDDWHVQSSKDRIGDPDAPGLEKEGHGSHVIGLGAANNLGAACRVIDDRPPAIMPEALAGIVGYRRPPQAGGARHEKRVLTYASKVLVNAERNASAATEGNRNHALFVSAAKCGPSVSLGMLEEPEVVAALLRASADSGCTHDGEERARRSILSGVRKVARGGRLPATSGKQPPHAPLPEAPEPTKPSEVAIEDALRQINDEEQHLTLVCERIAAMPSDVRVAGLWNASMRHCFALQSSAPEPRPTPRLASSPPRPPPPQTVSQFQVASTARAAAVLTLVLSTTGPRA